MKPNTSRAVWRKGSRSSPNGDNCVETAPIKDEVAIRDSKDPDGGQLKVSTKAWRQFTDTVRR